MSYGHAAKLAAQKAVLNGAPVPTTAAADQVRVDAAIARYRATHLVGAQRFSTDAAQPKDR